MNKNLFCVIAETTPNRTWFYDTQGAVNHATELLRQPGQKASTFMIVEAKLRVELAAPPVKVTALPDTTGEHIKPMRGQCPICGHYGSDCTGRD